MPVYLLTSHAYRSWREDHPLGYVQRRQGLKGPSEALAQHRAARAKHEPVRFEAGIQHLLHRTVDVIARENEVRLHACATCPTHVHTLISFRSPACTCGASEHCFPDCNAREFAEGAITRLKRKMGQALAKAKGTVGRPYFSRGWDLTPVRGREHFDYLMEVYLPDHEKTQAGV